MSSKTKTTDLDEMAKRYSKRWDVSEDEAKEKIKKFIDEGPPDRHKAMPSAVNIFPPPVGPLSKKVQDIGQAALSTAYMGKTLKEMNQPPEEIEALKGELESVKETVNGMLELVNTTMREMQSTLEGKQAKEAREELIKELDEKIIGPIRADLETVKKSIREEKPPEETRETIKDLRTKLQSAEEDAKGVLEDLGYKLPGKRGPGPAAPPEEKSTEDLIATLKEKGYHVEYGMISREQALEMVKEAARRAQEDMLDDKRIDAVTDIVGKAIDRIFDMFTEPLRKWMEGSLETRRAEGGGEPSKRKEQSASQPSSA